MDNLTFIKIIGQGKYGQIWKGKLKENIVAIKNCINTSNNFWKNECQIYSLPLLSHPNIPQFYQKFERFSENGLLEECLVIEYGQYGSLQSYLNENTFDWSRMCQLFKSLVKGIAFLHTELNKDGEIKPSIAHCGLSSANIVVKADGTCMICDFQYAVSFPARVKPKSLEERSDDVRYLAPEILANNNEMNPTESLLKQADIYSLGLIIWEIATRCSELYQGIDVPNYKLPFEHEIGKTPTLDQMRLLVNRHKARPLFPDIWKDSNYAIRLLKQTITECWDHEPEARLTALCIEERISELPLLWKRHKMETLSNCYVITLMKEHSKYLPVTNNNENDLSGNENLNKNNNNKNYSLNEKINHEYSNVCINKFENSLHCKYNDHNHLLHHPLHRHYFQSLTNNSEKHYLNINKEKNLNMNWKNNQPKLTLPVQPHHGRNPCLERNLMIDVGEENEILEQGLKFRKENYIEINLDNLTNDLETNDSQNGEMNSENRSLIQAPMPIPFVQNSVHYTGDIVMTNKIKDINKYRNYTQRKTFLQKNIINYLIKKFNRDSMKENQSKTKIEFGDRKENQNIIINNNKINNEISINTNLPMISIENNCTLSIGTKMEKETRNDISKLNNCNLNRIGMNNKFDKIIMIND